MDFRKMNQLNSDDNPIPVVDQDPMESLNNPNFSVDPEVDREPQLSDIDVQKEIDMVSDDMSLDIPEGISENPQAPEPMISEGMNRQQILDAYRRLKPAQEKYQQDLSNIGMLQGANMIAQGFARGHGANIGAGEEGIRALQAQAKEGIDSIGRELDTAKNTMGTSKMLMDYDEAEKMNDPESDVSKLYREQAYKILGEKSPLVGKLENMSASQLQKLGFKFQQDSGAMPFAHTDRILPDGTPVVFDKRSGMYYNSLTREPITDQAMARDVARKDALTGQYGLMYGGQMNVKPTNYGGAINQLTSTTPDGKTVTKEITYGDFARNAPEQAKKFDQINDLFIKEMQDSRDVATSVTNLSSKLKNGDNNNLINEINTVNSGLLGGIQTQAAKMAGQKGVLTDQDLVKFAGAGGVKAKINRIIDGSIFGEMTDDDVNFFKRFAQLMGKSLDEDILNRSKYYVDRARQVVDTTYPGITSENIAKMLSVDLIAPAVQNVKKTSKSTTSPGMVRMKTPDGRLIEIPKENVEKAKARGAVEVK